MIEKLCGEANVDAKDVIIAYLTKQVQELESQLYEASIQIQELIEQDVWCPSNCEKLEKLQQENKKQKELIDKAVLELANIDGNLSNSQLSDRICNLIDILKEVE